jgi:hypothetical protein
MHNAVLNNFSLLHEVKKKRLMWRQVRAPVSLPVT